MRKSEIGDDVISLGAAIACRMRHHCKAHTKSVDQSVIVDLLEDETAKYMTKLQTVGQVSELPIS